MILSEILRSLPANTQITFRVDELRKILAEEQSHTSVWIGSGEAVDITKLSPRNLRLKAVRWNRMMLRGDTPPVRVRKNGELEGSHWLFDAHDCRAYTPAHQTVDIDEHTQEFWDRQTKTG